MNYLIFCGISVMLIGYVYLALIGLQIRRTLASCGIGPYQDESFHSIEDFEQAYIDKVHAALKAKKHAFKVNETTLPPFNEGLSSSQKSLDITNHFINYIAHFVKKSHKSSLFKLSVVNTEDCLSFKETLTLLRIIFRLSEKMVQTKIESTEIFMLCGRHFQLSVEVNHTYPQQESSTYALVGREIQQSSLRIIHFETSCNRERLVIGIISENEDHSSGRPRNIQRKY